MPQSRNSDQLPMFNDAPEAAPAPTVRPWRPTPADAWTDDGALSAGALESQSLDLLRRDLEFLKAMELHGRGAMPPDLRRFQERHEELVRHLTRWLADADADSARPALATVRELADLRRRILAGLEPDRLREVMAAETRVRIPDLEIERELKIAELELAEGRGEPVEIDIADPGSPSSSLESLGFITGGMIEGLVQASMESMRAEQERRRLPARGGLSTLLRGLPVEWLDATWDALDLGSDSPRLRKDREREIADRLADGATLRWS